MKKLPILTAGLALMSLSLSQCVVAPMPVESGPAAYSTSYTTGYGTGYSSGYYGGGYYGGYGATGRVATNAMWAGARAYGIHERNETRQNTIDNRHETRQTAINNRTERVNHAVNNYSRPAGGAYRGGGGGRRR